MGRTWTEEAVRKKREFVVVVVLVVVFCLFVFCLFVLVFSRLGFSI